MRNPPRDAPTFASRLAFISATAAVVIGAESFLAWSAGGGMKKRVGIVEGTEDNGRIIRDLLTSFYRQPQTLGRERISSKPKVKTCRGAVSFNPQRVSGIASGRRTGPSDHGG